MGRDQGPHEAHAHQSRDANQYEEGLDHSRVIDAARRGLDARVAGEDPSREWDQTRSM